MKFIGITGGVGAGKSEILSYLQNKEGVRVMLADTIAHELMMPGQKCYMQILELFDAKAICSPDQTIDRQKFAQVIFGDEKKLAQINAIVHPAVKEYVLEQVEIEKKNGKLKYLFLEAALLIEEHYDEICDELWYIYTSEENRRERLKKSRGYSDEKIDSIFQSQLSEEKFRAKCEVTIDNNGSLEHTYEQIEEGLENE